MRAAQLTQPRTVSVIDRPEPDGAGRTVVRVGTAGVCGTDVSIATGKIEVSLPRILGHEAVGFVEATEPSGHLLVGQRVLIDPGISCDRCDTCRRGRPNLCPNGGLLGRDLDGVFAEFVAVKESQLLVLPESIDSRSAGLLQVLGTCIHATRRIDVMPGDTAVVIGLGVSGQLIVQLLATRGLHVLGVTRSSWKRALAERHGAARTAGPDDSAEVVEEMTSGRGADLVVEAVGTESTLAQSIRLAGLGGTIVMFGTITSAAAGLPYYDLYYKELTLLNPRAATRDDYARGIALVDAGALGVAPMVTHRYGLDDVAQAIEAVQASDSLKVLIDVA